MSLQKPIGRSCVAGPKRLGLRFRAGLASGATLLACAACGAAPQPDAGWGVITIGGATYRFPAEVFDGGQAYQGPQGSMLLELPLPNVTGDAETGTTRVLLVGSMAVTKGTGRVTS